MGKSIQIKAADGYVLSATLWESSAPQKGFVQINSGTGIPQQFYRHFAEYLAGQGYVVITFDYRGIGQSRPETLKGFDATNLQWGTHDMTAVMGWANSNYPSLRKIVIGHSMGGQLIGVMKNVDLIDKAILIASGTGFWRDMPHSGLKVLMPLLWYAYIPFSIAVLGYANAKKIKQGENLPKGVALQWRKWCLSEKYWESDFEKLLKKKSFTNFKGALDAFSFTDDKIVSLRAKEQLLGYYCNSQINKVRISPDQFKLERIGHFGFFSRKSKSIWPHVVDGV